MGGPNRRSPLRPLRGREKQISHITAALQAVSRSGHGKVLLLESGPGTGKTHLLIESVGLAVRGGMGVVSGVSAASDALFGAVPAALTGHVYRLGAADTASAVPAGVSFAKEIRARLREALEHGQAVVALDDLHLADPLALFGLGDLIGQLGGHPVLWLLATGTGSSSARHSLGEIGLGKLPVERLPELGPLSGQAAADVVADHLGAPPSASITLLAESVGARPRAVIELARALLAEGEVQVSDGMARLVAQQVPPPRQPEAVRTPAPVPGSFATIVRQDLRSLSPFTTKVLKLAAVLGSPFTPTDLLALLDESPADLLTALDEAIARGFLVCRVTDFAFRSDALWRVALDSVPPPMRALLHRQAATMLLSRPDGVEAAALHVAHVAEPGDIEAVRIIARAVDRMLASQPLTAAALARQGMKLLSSDQPEWTRLAAAAAEALVRAGDAGRAAEFAQDAVGEVAAFARERAAAAHTDAVAAFRTWFSVALLMKGKAHEAGRMAGDALTAGAGSREDRERAESSRLAAHCLTEGPAAAEHAERLLGGRTEPPRTVRAGALTVRALGRWREGRAAEAIGILREAAELDRLPQVIRLLDPRWLLVPMLTRAGEFEEALDVVGAAARLVPVPARTAVSALLRAPVHLANGRLGEADEDARSGLAAGEGLCLPMLAPQAWRVRALVALRRGLLGEAEAHLSALQDCCPPDSARPWRAMRQLLGAQIAEARSGPAAAVDHLCGVWASAEARRELLLEDVAAAAGCVRWALEAHREDIARAAVDTAESLRRDNRDLRGLAVAAAHARALFDGDAEGLAQVGRAHRDPWARAAAAEDRARLLLAHGDREAAICELERSMNGYGALDGERDGARVRRELRHLGVRRRHWKHAKRPMSGWDSLTKAERRVAELVAGGLTNRQVASQLFVSPHTVGFHLRQVYRKLGLRSRVDLIRLRS
ncbi:helix-turn-helix transcriptional regulator [Streptomyces marincola]|uniref:helix-turn-helix transcriptional regulator n=1 Tax=Streptomyces marincola TaxID=2878388 RepID=UPI00384C1D6D